MHGSAPGCFMKRLILSLGLILAGGLVLGAGCERPGGITSSTPGGILKGVTLTPRSFEAADFNDFFDKAKQAGEIVSWSGDWNELSNLSGGGPTVTAGLAKTKGYVPMIIAQFFTQSSGKLLRPLNEENKKNYKSGAVAFVQKNKPPYLGLGIEVNMLYEKSPADFEAFVRLFDEVYDAVKAASPGTKVFTVFQLERMKGLLGGLFGGKNDPSKSNWELVDKFPKADFLAFTTYPGLIYKSPAEIPADYYSEIKSRINKPIVFTEIGWHSVAAPVGWESSGAEQAEFVRRFFELTKELKPEMAVWSFLYDQETIQPFNSMGLFDAAGPKPAWDAWLAGK